MRGWVSKLGQGCEVVGIHRFKDQIAEFEAVGFPDCRADDDIFPGGIHAAEHTKGIGPDRVGVDLRFERMDLSAPAFDDEIDFPAAFM